MESLVLMSLSYSLSYNTEYYCLLKGKMENLMALILEGFRFGRVSLGKAWFKVTVSVTDSEGPEAYQSGCISLVSGDT